jgi:hypothetical protein
VLEVRSIRYRQVCIALIKAAPSDSTEVADEPHS